MRKKILIIILGIIIILGAILTIYLVKNAGNVSDLEKVFVTKLTEDYDNLEFAFDTDEINASNYITFVMYKRFALDGNTTMKFADIERDIKKYFDENVSVKDLEKMGVTALMNENFIMNTDERDGFIIKLPKDTYQTIPLRTIYKYVISDIEKDHDNYVVTYDKYKITNPYEVYNYYTANKASEEDLTAIDKYLGGNMPVINFLKFVNKDNVKEIGEDVGTLEITYKLVDDEFVIR